MVVQVGISGQEYILTARALVLEEGEPFVIYQNKGHLFLAPLAFPYLDSKDAVVLHF